MQRKQPLPVSQYNTIIHTLNEFYNALTGTNEKLGLSMRMQKMCAFLESPELQTLLSEEEKSELVYLLQPYRILAEDLFIRKVIILDINRVIDEKYIDEIRDQIITETKQLLSQMHDVRFNEQLQAIQLVAIQEHQQLILLKTLLKKIHDRNPESTLDKIIT